MRFSAGGQARFAAAELSADTDWTEVAADLQRQVLREAGAEASPENLALLRTAGERYPALSSISVYRRENTAARGILSVGMPAPDCPMGPSGSMLAMSKPGTTMVLVAGSYT
jgi:hypothetical protein